MEFISEQLSQYLLEHSEKEPELLAKLSRETYQKVLQPRMLSGHYQGRLLSLISKIKSPGTILEIGTYTGYSALCLAEGLLPKGKLHTIDVNEELFDLQERYFKASEFKNNIVQHLGNALDIIPEIGEKYDLIFIDADKPNYPHYFDLVIERMNPGALLLSDNVLWSGKVLETVKKEDSSTLALLEYNKKVASHKHLQSLMLPVRDGLTLSRFT